VGSGVDRVVRGDAQAVPIVKVYRPNVIGLVYKDTCYGPIFIIVRGIFIRRYFLREYVPDGSDGIGAGYALLRHVQFMDAAHFVHAVLGPVQALGRASLQELHVHFFKRTERWLSL
jgi:hypothetical protein